MLKQIEFKVIFLIIRYNKRIKNDLINNQLYLKNIFYKLLLKFYYSYSGLLKISLFFIYFELLFYFILDLNLIYDNL